MTDTNLKELLIEHAGLIYEDIKNGKLSGNYKKSFSSIQYYKILEFDYDKNGVSSKMSEQGVKQKKSYLGDFVKVFSKFRNFKTYPQLIEEFLMKNISKEKADAAISRFSHFLIMEMFSKKVTSEKIQKYSEQFIDEINSRKIFAGVSAELTGLTLERSKIIFKKGFILRRPNFKDLEKEIHFTPVFLNNHISDSILQIRIHVNSEYDVDKEIDRLICLIRLFRVINCNSASRTYWTNSVTRFFGGRSFPIYSPNSFKKYFLTKDETKLLKKFVKKLSPAVSEKLCRFTDLEKSDYVEIAYSRYVDALFHSFALERKITDLLMGFESLYLKKDERDELDFRMLLRVSAVLGAFNQNNRIPDLLKTAYSIRNPYAHGSVVTKKQVKNIEINFESTENYLIELFDLLRLSILIFLTKKIEKEEFLSLVDSSFYNSASRKKLTTLLKSLKIYLKTALIKN